MPLPKARIRKVRPQNQLKSLAERHVNTDGSTIAHVNKYYFFDLQFYLFVILKNISAMKKKINRHTYHTHLNFSPASIWNPVSAATKVPLSS